MLMMIVCKYENNKMPLISIVGEIVGILLIFIIALVGAYYHD